jgi:SAM-dependent methyltransferase
MEKKLIHMLQCPYCGGSFRLTRTFRMFPKSEKIRFGILQCACDVFPIAEGIVYLKKIASEPPKNQAAVALFEAGQFQKATSVLFDERRRAKLPYTLLLKGLFRPKTIAQFLGVLQLFTPASRAWLTHLAQRQRRPTFFLSLAQLAYLKQSAVAVDVGCSAGWFLSALLSKSPRTAAIGVETSFSALYLARHFILKQKGNLVCADADLGLPLQPAAAGTVFVNDTFMYLVRKEYFLQEAFRILKPGSLLFLTHVHAAGFNNDGQGFGLSSKELASYARKYRMWGTPDEELYRTLASNKPHSYTRVSSPYSLKHRSYSFVLAKNMNFVPQSSPAWVHRLLSQTKLDRREDPQLQV